MASCLLASFPHVTVLGVLIPVAVPSKAWVCGHSLAEIVGSNPAGVWVLCVFRSLRLAEVSWRWRQYINSILLTKYLYLVTFIDYFKCSKCLSFKLARFISFYDTEDEIIVCTAFLLLNRGCQVTFAPPCIGRFQMTRIFRHIIVHAKISKMVEI
jgi:hypothetical protein